MSLKPRNPAWQERLKDISSNAKFIDHLGIEFDPPEPGVMTSRLQVQDFHRQQNNFVHAGVLSTMADHTAGAAGGTLMAAGQVVLTIEFKINFLRPAIGDALRCTAHVIQNGLTVIVAESEVFYQKGAREKLVAKAMVTLGLVDSRFD